MTRKYSWVDKLIRSPSGNIIIWQTPNFPLTSWAIFSLISFLITEGKLHIGLKSLATAFIFVWAYQEIKDGESIFRKLLGTLVMSVTIFSFFR